MSADSRGAELSLEDELTRAFEEDAAGPSGSGSFEAPTIISLPGDVLLRVLSVVSAQDLLSVIRTSQALRALGSESVLWRRLYALRWGKDAAADQREDQEWKNTYVTRDRTEQRDAVLRGQNDPILKEILAAEIDSKRERAPDLALFSDEETLTVFGDGFQEEAIKKWRRKSGRTAGMAADARAAGHVCSASCNFEVVHDEGDTQVYMCVETGMEHVCGEHCTERKLDADRTMLTCPISGRAWPSGEPDEDEVGHGGRRRRGRTAGAEGEDEFGDEEEDADSLGEGEGIELTDLKGMYLMGYNARNEGEIANFFGLEYQRREGPAPDADWPHLQCAYNEGIDSDL